MRKRKDFRRSEGIRSSRLVVIAAEGRYTENIYFEAMKVSLHASDVHVEVLHRDTNESSPNKVYTQIRDFITEYDIEDDDQLWIVVGKDRWQDKMLSEVARYCTINKNLNFCVSNPCFELWLMLHFEDVASYTEDQMMKLAENKKETRNSDTWTKKKMKQLMGSYNESKYDVKLLLPKIDDAIKRAKSLDVNTDDRWPQRVGTRVYLLAQSIMGR